MRVINKKNTVILCILILIFIIFLSVVFLGLNKDGNYNTVVEINGIDDKNENAYSDEIWITAVYKDNTMFSLKELELPEGWAEKNGMIYTNGGSNADSLIIKGNVEKIEFLRHAWCGIVEIKVNGDIHEFDLYSEDAGTFEFNISDILKGETISPHVVAFALFLALYAIFSILFRFISSRKFKDKKVYVYIAKTVIFVVIFWVIFYNVQEILRHKWEGDGNMAVRYEKYKNANDASVDILFLGSSRVYASMYPVVMYEAYGITGFNLSISMQNAMTEYYMLEYALTLHTPKVVVFSLCGLTSDRKADNEAWEATYRKIAETMPDADIKNNLIKDIVNNNENQGYLSYYFPFFRYHSRWDSLKQEDFDKELLGKWYADYTYGSIMNVGVEKIETLKYADGSDIQINPESDYYLKKIIALCRDKNINCVVVDLPAFDGTWCGEISDIESWWCQEQDIPLIDYNQEELQKEIGLDLSHDFYNSDHLNRYGGRKVSFDIGAKLVEWYDLPRHAEASVTSEWDENVLVFHDKLDTMTY